MIKRFLLIWPTLLLFQMLCAGAITTIKGSVTGAQGYQIRLLTYADQITFIEKKLAASPIDSLGHFNLIVDLKSTTYAFFSIGNVRADIILEPGQAYEIQFDPYPSLDYLETRNLILQNEKLEYSILAPTGEEINQIVRDASIMFNRFLADHYMDLYYKRQPIIDAFIDTFFLSFGSYTHPWIRQMVDFRIASLKLSGFKITIDQAYDIWLKDVDFDYDHPDYMDFFNQLFDNYLTTRLKHYTFDELKTVINDQGSYFALSEMVGRDSVLRNELVREMVIIKSLGEIYHNRDFDEDQVLKILQFIAVSSKFREHRIIASNLIFINTRFNRGMMASDFALPDQFGKTHSISDFKGKYLYIIFFMSNCIPCLSELQYLQTLYPALNKDLEVMTIGLDPNPDKFWRAMEKQSYPWTTVHFNNDFELTDRYAIRNYPFFLLIAPDGSFEAYGARQPSSHFQPWFEEVLRQQK